MIDLWSLDSLFFLAVLAMSGVTFLLRAGGYFIMGRVPMTPRVRRGLETLPGAIIISTILPIALDKGSPAIICLALAVFIMAVFKRDLMAVIVAIAGAAGARYLGL